MSLLVIYESFEGQTKKIAEYVAERTSGKLIAANDLVPPDFDSAEAVILAAPVHQRRHPETFEAVLIANAAALAERRTLMLSVSLNAAFDEGLEEAVEYLIEMKMRTGLEPDTEALIGGALRLEKYDYFSMQVIKHVVMRGRSFDASRKVHDFTDWDALAKTVDAFTAA